MTTKTNKITLDDYKVIQFKKPFTPWLLGIRWSSRWMERHPYSLDGKNLPYFSITSLNKDDDTINEWLIMLGPLSITFSYLVRFTAAEWEGRFSHSFILPEGEHDLIDLGAALGEAGFLGGKISINHETNVLSVEIPEDQRGKLPDREVERRILDCLPKGSRLKAK